MNLDDIDRELMDLRDTDRLTVCDSCYRAWCWAGVMFCEDAQTAGTVDITVARARELALEDPSAWLELRRAEGYPR